MKKLSFVFIYLSISIAFFIPDFQGQLSANPIKTLRIAVAANFINAMETISPSFTKIHSIAIQPAYGSTGKLFAQMKNGAPYDLFLSADSLRPELLHKAGICERPFKYVSGSVVSWSGRTEAKNAPWQAVLASTTGKIAIANPETAPYGTSSFKILRKTGLLDSVKPRFVYGQSVGQTFVFAQTGNTELGFVALSQALSEPGKEGKYWTIPEAEKIGQWGCVSKNSHNKKAAETFISFLSDDTCRETLNNMGYAQ